MVMVHFRHNEVHFGKVQVHQKILAGRVSFSPPRIFRRRGASPRATRGAPREGTPRARPATPRAPHAGPGAPAPLLLGERDA